MEGIRVTARRLLDGKVLALSAMKSLTLEASLATPAVSMTGVFALESLPGELGEVRVYRGEEMVFAGGVDAQRSVLSGEGVLVELEARSKGGLLLDNQAMPCLLTNVGLSAVFRQLVEPFGFLLYSPRPSRVLAAYTVRAGVSVWEAFCGFVRRAFDLTPYVAGDTVMVDVPRSAVALTVSNTGMGHPFSRLEHRYIPYNILSDIVIRDGDGVYSAAVRNPSAAYHGAVRRRYVVPANEFTDDLSLDANQRIKKSMGAAAETVVTLPEFLDIFVGQEVVVADEGFSGYNLLARDVVWRVGASGVTTTLTLVSSVYGF